MSEFGSSAIWAAAVGGALGGGILTLLADELRAWIRRPKLTLSVGPDPLFQVQTPMRDESARGLDSIRAGGNNGLFLRALIENKGRSTARNCRVFLVSIERTASDGSRLKTGATGEALGLQFSFRDGEKTIDLPPGVPQFVDVMMSRSVPSPNRLELAFGGTPLRFEPLFSQPATFRLELVAVADSTKPTRLAAEFAWEGTWSSLRWKV
jgi:hypothetical protein